MSQYEYPPLIPRPENEKEQTANSATENNKSIPAVKEDKTKKQSKKPKK